MGEDGIVGFICVLDTGMVVHMHLVEVYLVILVIGVLTARNKLVDNWDSNAFMFLDYLLDIEGQEAIEGRDLL